MPIVQEEGHWKSYRTDDESDLIFKKKIETADDFELKIAQALVRESLGGDLSTILKLAEDQWDEVPVSIEEWISNPYYIGDIGENLYVPVRESLIDLFQVPCWESDYQEVILTGGFGWGKSVLSGLIILRILYELVCLKNPQATLGLLAGTKIYIMPIAHRVETARDVVFGEVVEKLRLIDFFRGRYKETLDEIRFKDKGIYIKGGASGDNAILGLTIFAAIIDESNFFGRRTTRGSAHEERGDIHDRAEGIYEGLVKRIKSRFEGKGGMKGRGATGKLIMASSKRGTNDFTERRIKKAAKEARIDVFIRDLATWDKNPEAFADVPRFKVLARSEAGVSRILEPEEDYQPVGNELVIAVPENWRRDFEQNPDKALRDVAGIATEGFDPFIKRRVAIKQAMTRGFPDILSSPTWDSDEPLQIHFERFMGKDANNRPVPLCCPNAQRHVHLDMSGTECATGFVIGHKGGTVELSRRDPKTQEITYETVPLIHIDVVLKITVPKIGEIHHPSVRQLVKRLHDGGLKISTITADQWNYIANKQELEKWGFQVQQLSVTRKPDPYVCLKEGLYDHRIYMPWHEPLRVELYDLEKNDKGKIVAPARSSVGTAAGSKDIADSLAGVVYYLTHMAADHGGAVVMPSRGISESESVFESARFVDNFGPVFESEEQKGAALLQRVKSKGKGGSKKRGRGRSGGGSVPVFGIT